MRRSPPGQELVQQDFLARQGILRPKGHRFRRIQFVNDEVFFQEAHDQVSPERIL